MSETKTKVIDGEKFEISQPYAEGHVCTAAEAKALNQVRSENIGNNLRNAVKEAKEAAANGDNSKLDGLAQLVADYDAQYVFTMGNAGASRKLDPVEREAQKIARELLKESLAAQGRKLTVAPEGESEEEWKDRVNAKVEEIAQNEAVLKQAKKNVEAKRKQAETLREAVNI